MNRPTQYKFLQKITEVHILIASVIVFILQYSFFSVNTLNFPIWLYLVLLLIALLINLLIGFVRSNGVLTFKEIVKNPKYFIVYLFLTSSLGLLFFGIINNTYSQTKELEYLKVNIVSVIEKTSRSSNRIYFKFNDEIVGISVPSSPVVSRLINNKDILERSFLELQFKKGLWGTYVVKDITILVR